MRLIQGPVIQTRMGFYFDLEHPWRSYVHIVDIAHALSNLCRFSGHCREFYSVAQHSVLVATIAPPEHALAALLHDAAEAYCGDVSAPLKCLLPDYRKVQREIERAVAGRFGLPADVPEVVKRADLVALATERRDLMPRTPERWACLEGIKPHPARIQAMPPIQAEALFLSVFKCIQDGEDWR